MLIEYRYKNKLNIDIILERICELKIIVVLLEKEKKILFEIGTENKMDYWKHLKIMNMLFQN